MKSSSNIDINKKIVNNNDNNYINNDDINKNNVNKINNIKNNIKDINVKDINSKDIKNSEFDISSYDYLLPQKLIATDHILPRDHSRLLYYDSQKKEKQDLIFKDIVDFFSKGDILVLNNTKVKKTFLKCKKKTGSVGSLSLLEKISEKKYKIALHQRNPKVGTILIFENKQKAVITKANLLDFEIEFEKDPNELIEKYATYTLPSYIKSENTNKELYQTIYSDSKKENSIAAPTAGLHFTEELFNKLKEKGVEILFVSLNVGLGTFASIKVKDIREHNMHSEEIEITKEVADKINNRKGKLFLVGTTSLRTMESFTDKNGIVNYGKKSTNIFIYPGYKFNLKFNGIITNFHLPKSTLIMLVSTLVGKNEILNLYKYAIGKKYRFYSLGDAMFLNNLDL
ncbi:MAG: tRNA preQ1(34) S-adenosylmethionine ribosyltransferase-isomerase QueA [Candidatus Nanoarchaeia archaeon]|nr:tRNA preQ1(34) S-adenosylmethionine ribosyltransferase-isomerase QueA [Candidatus Nanoarchaeia archaeon]